MPNRMLRDWTQSDKIDLISCEAERFFTRLIMKADDYGCFWADTRLLKANLFPLKLDKIREADLFRWMVECQKADLIVLYEHNQKKYLQIKDFRQRLDKAKAKFPLPPNDIDSVEVVNDFPAEEKRIEAEKELEGKGSGPSQKNGFVKHDPPGDEILFTIEHCLTVAMNDSRWVRANKTNEKELEEFNSLLEQRGIYQKNPLDYKTHFANWKRLGKKADMIEKSSTSSNAREDKARQILNL